MRIHQVNRLEIVVNDGELPARLQPLAKFSRHAPGNCAQGGALVRRQANHSVRQEALEAVALPRERSSSSRASVNRPRPIVLPKRSSCQKQA